MGIPPWVRQHLCNELGPWAANHITYLGAQKWLSQNANIFQIFPNYFSLHENYCIWSKFNWRCFPSVQSTISCTWMRLWLGADQMTSYYLNYWRSNSWMHTRITQHQWLKTDHIKFITMVLHIVIHILMQSHDHFNNSLAVLIGNNFTWHSLDKLH